MRKIFISILILLFGINQAYATTWYACTSGGNWSANIWTSVLADQGTCAAALGTPVAGDTATLNSSSGNITLTAAAASAFIDETGYTGTLAFGAQTLTLTTGGNLGGAMTSTSGTIVNSGGTVTLLSTATGSFPTLKQTGAQTWTSGGFTWPGAVNFDNAGATTLIGNWITSGLTTFTLASVLNHTTSETYTANGGLTMTSASGTNGSATIVIGGGTWQGAGQIQNNLTLAGSSTVSGTVAFGKGLGGSTLTYSSGTITITGSTLNIGTSSTVNTNGMTWNNITLANTLTTTLGSNLTLNGLLSVGTNTETIVGAFNLSTHDILFNSSNNNTTFIFPASQTLTVTNSMSAVNGGGQTTTIKSGTGSTAFNLTYQGTKANLDWHDITATDVNASTSSVPILNTYSTANGTSAPVLTRTTNIFNQLTGQGLGASVAF